jgi:hypothetical protein
VDRSMESSKRMGMGSTICGMELLNPWGMMRRISYVIAWCVMLAPGSIIGPFVLLRTFSFENTHEFLSSCLPNISQAFEVSAFAMIFLSLRDIKAGEQLFYPYCGLHQSAADRKAELALYGIAQCICSPCVNATSETDNIRKTFLARVTQYKTKSVIWERLRKVPPGTLDEMLTYQSAVQKEGLDTDVHYWGYFLPALITAYQCSGRSQAAKQLTQDMLRGHNFIRKKAAFERSG